MTPDRPAGSDIPRAEAFTRRDLFGSAVGGLAGVALAALAADSRARAGDHAVVPWRPAIDPRSPCAPRGAPLAARAKRVLTVFVSGAISHLDTFDWKPELARRSGTPMPGSAGLVTFQGENGDLAGPLWRFRPRGQSGKMMSDLLPRLAEHADRLCFLHGMTTKSNTHGPAETAMSTGFILEGYPGMGAWVSYALGSENADLPAFVAIPDPRGVPQVGPNHWNSAFLPAAFQGTPFAADRPIPHLARPAALAAAGDRASRDYLKLLNERHLARHPEDTDLAARIAAHETAARMQLAAADVGDLERETRGTRERYGIDDPDRVRAGFARNCLLARRLLERGVRFVQLFNGAYAMGEGVGNWDGHRKLREQYDIHAPILDKPLAALLEDLASRGLLADTLVLFVTEFGRMPTFQKGATGRDHNPAGFTVWLAGAGVKAPFSFGGTDEFGHKAVTGVTSIHDLHATVLHLVGLDHERLSVYHNGIERRLTDVHGRVIQEILA